MSLDTIGAASVSVPAQEEPRTPWAPGAVAWCALGVAAFLLWTPPLRSGLTIDEVHTWWIVKDDLRTTLERSLHFSHAPPLYFFLAHVPLALGMTGEASLRLPSIVAAALSVLVVYRIGRHLRDAETGFLAAAAFVASHAIALAACDARPYALGVLAVTTASLALVNGLESPSIRNGTLYGVIAGISIDTHVLVATALIAHPVSALAVWRRAATRPPLSVCAAAIVAATAVAAPVLVHMLAQARRPADLVWQPTPGWNDLAGALVPPSVGISAAAIVVLVVLRAIRSFDARALADRQPALVFATAWHALPLALLFVVAIASQSLKFFIPHRYLVGAEPGLALLLGIVVRALEPARTRRLLAAAFVTVAVVSGMTPRHDLETFPLDWRTAVPVVAQLAQENGAPVLAGSGFFTIDAGKFLEPEYRSAALAAFERYPLSAELTPLPSVLSETTRSYFDDVVGRVEKQRAFIVTGRAADNFFDYIGRHASRHGFAHTKSFVVGGARVDLYERKP